jgi:hypothetical protein
MNGANQSSQAYLSVLLTGVEPAQSLGIQPSEDCVSTIPPQKLCVQMVGPPDESLTPADYHLINQECSRGYRFHTSSGLICGLTLPNHLYLLPTTLQSR